MATSKRLSKDDVHLLHSLLHQETSSSTDSEDLRFLASTLAKTRSLETTVNKASTLTEGGPKERIKFLHRLHKYSVGRLALVHHVATHADIRPTTIRNVAANIHLLGLSSISPAIAIEEEVLSHMRCCLLIADPTATIVGLVASRLIPVDAALQPHVMHVLQSLLAQEFNLSKQSVRSIIENDRVMRAIPQNQQQKVANVVAMLQRLQNVVEDPEHIAALVLGGYTSARAISNSPCSVFVAIAGKAGIQTNAAQAIWNNSTAVTHRNQRIWAEQMRVWNDLPIKAVYGTNMEQANTPQAAGNGKTTKAPADINLSTLFPDLQQEIECEECSSLTSPAAYFTDLLQALKKCPVKKTFSSTQTALSLLLKRSPGLGDLKLSCANTHVLIPYIDLVNEALESIISSRYQARIEPAWQSEYSDETEEDNGKMPQHVDFSIYEKVIGPVVFPLSHFPYNQAIDTIRTYLEAVGSSREAILRTFRPPSYLYPGTVTDRAISAECIGLLQEEYIAITHQAFQSCSYLSSNVKEYLVEIGLRRVHEYWGYASEAAMLATDTTGLAYIKDQFLPRANVSFQFLLEILGTRYVGRQLAIVSIKDGKIQLAFTEDLNTLYLKSYPSGAQSGEQLKVIEWDSLQALLRLLSKLGWSLVDVDANVVMLGGSLKNGISPQVLNGLARIKQISQLTGLSISSLQPFWGDLDTNTKKSIYARIFLQRELVAEDSVFVADKKTGKYLAGDERISKHHQAIQLALHLSEAELNIFIAPGGWIEDDKLTLQNVSLMYRISLLCKTLGIPIEQYNAFCSIFSPGSDIFHGPKTTQGALESYLNLKKHGWDLETLLFTLRGSSGAIMQASGFQSTATIVGATVALVAQNTTAVQKEGLRTDRYSKKNLDITRGDIAFISSAVHGTDSGQKVENFVEGIQQVKTNVTFRNESDIPKQLRDKVQLLQCSNNVDWELVLTGLLSSEEENILINSRSGDAEWKNAIEQLGQESMTVYNRFIVPVAPDTSPTAFRPEPDTSKDYQDVQKEKARARRRTTYVDAVKGTLQTKICQNGVLKVLEPLFPRVDVALLQILLSDILSVKINNRDAFAMQALCSLGYADHSESSFTGYFLPPSTGVYSFTSSLTSQPVLLIDGVRIGFTWKTDKSKWFSIDNISLVHGQYFSLQFDSSPHVYLEYAVGQAPFYPVGSTSLICDSSVEMTKQILIRLARIINPVRLLSLNQEEVLYFHNSSQMDFNALTLDNIQALDAYASLRTSVPSGNNKTMGAAPLIAFYKGAAEAKSVEKLQSQLALATGWPESQLSVIIESKCPGYPIPDLIAELKNTQTLCQFRDILDLVSRLNLPGSPIRLLFSLALPRSPPFAQEDFKNARGLRLAVLSASNGTAFSSANDRLRDNQRWAMIKFLLQKPDIQKLGIRNPDDLFDYFLIDVKMGVQLKTSRLKQAISTVQTYIQRCVLGLEAQDGIDVDAGDRKNLEYLMRYRIWEANRKSFLYAESWIDPTLRDDKTEQFHAAEQTILQSKMTPESIAKVVREYITAVNETANLDVQAYLWDRYQGPGSRKEVSRLHVFARTRASPWKYFYRTCDLQRTETDLQYETDMSQYTTWHPWEKMHVEVQSHQLQNGVRNERVNSGCYMIPVVFEGRLFVFLPHITLTTNPKAEEAMKNDPENKEIASKGMTMESQTVTSKYQQWEIRMGWIEYQNGKWTTKQVSDDVLRVYGVVGREVSGVSTKSEPRDAMRHKEGESEGDEIYNSIAKKMADCLPGIETFTFRVDDRSVTVPATKSVAEYKAKILTIDVSRWVGPTNTDKQPAERYFTFYSRILGRFELINNRVVLTEGNPPAPNWPWPQAVPTQFMRVHWKVNSEHTSPLNYRLGRGTYTIQQTHTPKPELESMYLFTMSFNEIVRNKISALFVDIATENSLHSIFGYPSGWYTTVYAYDITLFHDPVAPLLMQAMDSGAGVDGIYSMLSSLPKTLQPDAFGKRWHSIPHELDNPYSLYTWEVAVHLVSLLMERLFSTHQYELALRVARWVLDPTASGTTLDRCWRFPVFRDPAARSWNPLDHLSSVGANLDIDEWKSNRGSIHAAGRVRPAAYMKRIALKYIEILIAAGDELFRQNTLETIPLAIQRYVEASHIFGPPPVKIPKLGKRQALSYNELEKKAGIDDFSDAAVRLELDFPFRIDSATPTDQTANLGPFLETRYFCIPTNPDIIALRALLDDRLYKCRNSMDIDGHTRKLSLFEPPIDPGSLVRGAAAGLTPSAIVNDIEGPMPNYRFQYLLQHAFELCRELKDMDARALMVKEKRDAEALSVLTAQQNASVSNFMVDLKNSQRNEVLAEIETLRATRRSHESRLIFYLRLTGDDTSVRISTEQDNHNWHEIKQIIGPRFGHETRMSALETVDMFKAETAMSYGKQANQYDNLAAIYDACPFITLAAEPFGIGISTEISLGILARVYRAFSQDLRSTAQDYQDMSSLASRAAELERQLQQRREIANQAGRDIEITDRMLSAAKERLAVCDKDILIQQKQADNARHVEEWLRSKYTSEQLYAWLDNAHGLLFQRTYGLAAELVKQVERAFRFERPTQDVGSLKHRVWDRARDGMLCAENMLASLQKLQMAYMDRHAHSFELVKFVSLRQVDPWALFSLRSTGTAQFTLPELLFDMDFPGHYCRRIASVSLSIPCIVGPYVSLNCTLKLLQHSYRVDKTPETYSKDDSQLATDNIPITSIAIGSPSPGTGDDTGTFQIAFQGPSYGPFEGAGVISKWEMDLPPTIRQFDYNTISDLVLRLRYTAHDGGALLKNAANEKVFQELQTVSRTPLSMLIDVSNYFPTQWHSFQTALQQGASEASITLTRVLDLMPFWTRGMNTKPTTISLIVSPISNESSLLESMKINRLTIKWIKGGKLDTKDLVVLHWSPSEPRPIIWADWQVEIPNVNKIKLVIQKMWFLVQYTAEAS